MHRIQRPPQGIERLIRRLQNLFLVSTGVLFQPPAPRGAMRPPQNLFPVPRGRALPPPAPPRREPPCPLPRHRQIPPPPRAAPRRKTSSTHQSSSWRSPAPAIRKRRVPPPPPPLAGPRKFPGTSAPPPASPAGQGST